MSIKNWTLPKALPWILLVGGIIGYLCAFIIMYDKVQLADNPDFRPSCSLNPVMSCGDVMKSGQANTFGFPNPFIGLGAFPAMAVVGLAMLAGARFKRWFWLALYGGYGLGTAFAYWLLLQSVYRIQALCPYCLAIDVVMTATFWYLTLYMVDQRHIRLPKGRARQAYGWIRRHHLDILIAWFLLIIAVILNHFWYYYGRYF
ncbi:MAG TPA: vitamin K epoxide reductase family protein [Candidatus Saccharimonadales bacterium]|nr:vitamin K epoxide reductase family protein [Candidatus Saccharimonadales bacterium]